LTATNSDKKNIFGFKKDVSNLSFTLLNNFAVVKNHFSTCSIQDSVFYQREFLLSFFQNFILEQFMLNDLLINSYLSLLQSTICFSSNERLSIFQNIIFRHMAKNLTQQKVSNQIFLQIFSNTLQKKKYLKIVRTSFE
jgi:hypothetical protein